MTLPVWQHPVAELSELAADTLPGVGRHPSRPWDQEARREGRSVVGLFVCCDAGEGAATLSGPQAGAGRVSTHLTWPLC